MQISWYWVREQFPWRDKTTEVLYFKSAVKYLISLICLQRVAIHWNKKHSYFFPIFPRIQILAHTPGIYHRVYQDSMLVNMEYMLSIKWCSAVFLNLMTTWNNCWAMWILKFVLNDVSSLMWRWMFKYYQCYLNIQDHVESTEFTLFHCLFF